MEETKVETKSALDHATSVYGEHDGIWVYVGTYHKYNCGSIEGRWLCLNDFIDEDQFLEACKELHKDEEDPELMYQDYEGPKAFYSESRLDSKVWEFLSLDDSDQETVQTYIENRELRDFQDIIDNYTGTYSSPEDYVQGYWEDCGDFKANDAQWWHPSNYTDWARMAHDLEMSGDVDFIPCDGGVMVFNSF